MPSGLSSVLNSHRIYLSDIDWLFLSRAMCFFRSRSYHIHRPCFIIIVRVGSGKRKERNAKTTARSQFLLPLLFQNTKLVRFVKQKIEKRYYDRGVSHTMFFRSQEEFDFEMFVAEIF